MGLRLVISRCNTHIKLQKQTHIKEIIVNGPAKQDVEHLLSEISRGSFEIIIPQMILGEVMTKILQKYDDVKLYECLEKFGNMIQKYGIDANTCLTPLGNNAPTIMTKLRQKDTYLDVTYIMILSHMLIDPRSKFFLTPDNKLLDNPKIIKYEKKLSGAGLRKEKLKIIERV